MILHDLVPRHVRPDDIFVRHDNGRRQLFPGERSVWTNDIDPVAKQAYAVIMERRHNNKIWKLTLGLPLFRRPERQVL